LENSKILQGGLIITEVKSWEDGPLQPGMVFLSPNGTGLIEIEERIDIPIIHEGLYIEIMDVHAWYQKLTQKEVKILQPLV